MAVFKPINKSDVEVVSTVINKTQNLNTASLGLTIADYRSGSFADETNYTITSTGDKYHYYNSVYHNFYSSCSFKSKVKSILSSIETSSPCEPAATIFETDTNVEPL